MVQKLRPFYLRGGFCQLELHREGSVPAACAACLFIYTLVVHHVLDSGQQRRGGVRKMLKSFLAAVLISASVKRLFVSRRRDFLFLISISQRKLFLDSYSQKSID